MAFIARGDPGGSGTTPAPTPAPAPAPDPTPAPAPATGSGAQIQDPSTGQWYPYVPGDAHDNGRGNIQINGQTYSYYAGQQAYGTSGGSLGDRIASGGSVGAVNDPNVAGTSGDPGLAGGSTMPNPNPAPADTTPAPATGTGGTGTGGASGGGVTDPSLYAPFTGQQPGYVAPVFPTLPTYTPPPAFNYGDFQAPTLEQAQSQPGYQFGLQQGEQALQQAAAAKGLLRSGGTLKDILNYGQNAATQNYANVFNQNLSQYNTNRAGAVQQYNTNYQTQFQDPYAAVLHGYDTASQNALGVANSQNNFNSDAYKTAADVFYANENNPFAKYSTLLDIGTKTS